jgi:hypothetical protein
MTVRREIVVYQKEGDKFIEKVEIDVSIDFLIGILDVNIEEDPNVYMIYKIDEEQYSKFQKLIPDLKVRDFNDIDLFCECFQV